MNYVEVRIGNPSNAILDLSQEFSISLVYSISDIRDISTRNASFSKTILFPGTKNNNFWFGNLYDVNADFTMFNPNVKTPCSISVNREEVMRGVLQLKKIKKLNNTDQSGNLIYYECVVFNNAIDLMTELGEKMLNSLDLSELRHDYTLDNIVFSWTQSWANGWVYPMYGTPTKDPFYNVTDFYPSYYSRYLLDSICQQAGYGWTGSLGYNNQFLREIIPFIGSGSQSLSQDLIDEKNLRVGITQSFTQSYTFCGNGTGPQSFYGIGNQGLSQPGISYLSATYSLNSDSYIDNFNPALNFYDNGNTYNPATSIWTTNVNRKWAPQWQLNYNLQLYNPNSYFIRVVALITPGASFLVDDPKFDIYHLLEYKPPATTTWLTWDSQMVRKNGFQKNSANGYLPNTGVSQNINFTKSAPELFIPTGTQVRIRVEARPSSGGAAAPFNQNQAIFYCYKSTGTPNGYAPNQPAQFQLKITPQVSPQNYLFSNGLVFAAQEGDPISAKDWLGSKIKQKDFITDLIKRYNLYIQTDPNNDNLLIFDTRPDFYQRQNLVDWTNKKDLLSEDEIVLLSELQFKEVLFTMKDDNSDKFNSDYTALVGDIYGQYRWTFGNEFVKKQQKIESPFSPTPLIKTAFGAVIPAISHEDPKVSPRVLYWGGLVTPPPSNNLGFQWQLKGQSNLQNFTSYPYAGHFDNPLNPTLDIHFGTPKYMYYYDYGVLPYNTMYQTYWADWLESITDGRMLIANFALDEFDVKTIKDNFWTKVFVKDAYYYVNKIIDYKPMERSLTKVELLKIKTGLKAPNPGGKTQSIARPIRNIRDTYVNPNFGNNNTGNGGVIIVGSNNTGGGSTINGSFSKPNIGLVVGNNNILKSSNGAVIGEENSATGRDVLILGGSNMSIEGQNIITIGRSGATISDINSSYIGDEIKADLGVKGGFYSQFPAGVNISVEGYNLGHTDWSIIPEEKEIKIQSGKQINIPQLTILGHLDIESGLTFSFGSQIRYKVAKTSVKNVLDISGLLTVGGLLWIGNQ